MRLSTTIICVINTLATLRLIQIIIHIYAMIAARFKHFRTDPSIPSHNTNVNDTLREVENHYYKGNSYESFTIY